MKQIKSHYILSILFAGTALMLMMNFLQACSKKSTSSKTSLAATTEPAQPAPPPPAEEKDGMQIKRDAAGNYVIQLVIVNLEPVKLMKPVKEGYIVWMTNEAGVTSNIGTIEGANTWTTRKDKSRFEATSAVKPTKVFISAETDLKAQKPGTQIVWSTGNF
ncbi:MAG: hypothetical protein JNM14_00340 [Ferruginibacter sp.]|nr:hypothetical protein [Ferruginibacter sp.]